MGLKISELALAKGDDIDIGEVRGEQQQKRGARGEAIEARPGQR
jgi:hypothetical protein